MKLNLGCGNNKIDDWINVDKEEACNPDKVVDLEVFPWPWPDNGIDDIKLIHVLEHLGQTTDKYLEIIKELYRICRPGAHIHIRVPHPHNDHFLDDPTHVRPITIEGMRLFDQEKNNEWKLSGVPSTPLGIYLGVNMKVVSWEYLIDPFFQKKVDAGEVSLSDVRAQVLTDNNIVREIIIEMEVCK